jgi:spore germination protein
MKIHVVQDGETIQSIANQYGVSAKRLIQENGIENVPDLSEGQTIVITDPDVVHVVKEGDSLFNIAANYKVSITQLIANNPYLLDHDYIFPGDEIVVSYPYRGKLTTHGNTVPYIDRVTLIKTLPNLTYLSILNYTATKEGGIVSYYDDTEVIQLAKEYSVVPLMLLTTLTIQGEANLRTDFDLILNEDFQNIQIENILNILKTKGYLGLNISLQYISESNIKFYESYFTKVSRKLNEEGYEVFATIDPNISGGVQGIGFEKVNYSEFNQLAYNLIFMTYEWAAITKPPSPISSISNTEAFLQYILEFIPSDKIIIGIATIGYDWELPYIPGVSSVNYASYSNFLSIVYNNYADIKFDEVSKTPYFIYKTNKKVEHIVWFIDSRTIQATLDLIEEYQLKGLSIWNITVYNPQLWLIINSQYSIEKLI